MKLNKVWGNPTDVSAQKEPAILMCDRLVCQTPQCYRTRRGIWITKMDGYRLNQENHRLIASLPRSISHFTGYRSKKTTARCKGLSITVYPSSSRLCCLCPPTPVQQSNKNDGHVLGLDVHRPCTLTSLSCFLHPFMSLCCYFSKCYCTMSSQLHWWGHLNWLVMSVFWIITRLASHSIKSMRLCGCTDTSSVWRICQTDEKNNTHISKRTFSFFFFNFLNLHLTVLRYLLNISIDEKGRNCWSSASSFCSWPCILLEFPDTTTVLCC